MKKYILLFIVLPLLALALDEVVVPDPVPSEVPSEVLTIQGITVDIKAVFNEKDIPQVRQGLGLDEREDKVLAQVLKNEERDPNDGDTLASVLQKQVQGKTFSSAELKYLTGLTGGNAPEDRVKYLAYRKLNEK